MSKCTEGTCIYRKGSSASRKKTKFDYINPHIKEMKEDVLYHIALGTNTHDLVKMFGDTKFVVMGGTPERMKSFAEYIMKEIEVEIPSGTTLLDISKVGHRFSMFKVGPVISVSHGMGTPSVGILLHELIKLMYHAQVSDPIFFRIGTCGGIGFPPGTVVITELALNSSLRNAYELPVFGNMTSRPAKLDLGLIEDLKSCIEKDDKFQTVSGSTVCTDDFYEGQGRLDGAFCDYTENDKLAFLEKLRGMGVCNMEMESTVIAALTHQAGIKCGIICVTLLNRLEGDQISASADTLNEYQERPQILLARYIKKKLKCSESCCP